ncbi:MAG: hypothetical protein HYV63_09965 [Candidatus Schekmanbacteria bacterium]|nr:hypothetical protein [Candidatus Schekmanbacteria bacterium]
MIGWTICLLAAASAAAPLWIVDADLSSPHDYPSDSDVVAELTVPGATTVRVHFDRIEVEEGRDFVSVLDGAGREIMTVTGMHRDLWTSAFATDTVKVRLTSDAEVSDFGYEARKILATGPAQPRSLPDIPIDAAVAWENGKVYFFSGPQYIRYDVSEDQADDDYPRLIAGNWPGLWPGGIDAAVNLGDGTALFFRDGELARYDVAADRVAAGYPKAIAQAAPGVWPDGVDTALRGTDAKIYLFHGDEYIRFDVGAWKVDAGYPRPIAQGWPGLWPAAIGAATSMDDSRAYFFRGAEYSRYNRATDVVDSGYPLRVKYYWPGLWDATEGGSQVSALPPEIRTELARRPPAAEVAARRARVARSLSTDEVDLTDSYPRFVDSVEDILHTYGCGLIRRPNSVFRFRCATDTAGPQALELPEINVQSIDWRAASYHIEQVNQGDFGAAALTPLSILAADDGEYFIDAIGANGATGGISAGAWAQVSFRVDGVKKRISFAHLADRFPRYVVTAWKEKRPLRTGVAFGFIGHTGNLWIGTPPAADGPYSGDGNSLPRSHSHVWFIGDPANHMKLTPWARRSLDCTVAYRYGGG